MKVKKQNNTQGQRRQSRKYFDSMNRNLSRGV